MSQSYEIERYVKDSSLLIDLFRQVIENISTRVTDKDPRAMNVQLQEIAKTIDKLAAKGVPVPESLRAEKTNLAATLAIQEDAQKSLKSLIENIDALLAITKLKLGLYSNPDQPRAKPPKASRKRKRTKFRLKAPQSERSKLPKTEGETFRKLIIEILQIHNGQATPTEVINELKNRLEGKLLPGDLELRQDGKTIAWKNNVWWERHNMTQDGVLKKDSPRGIWALNEDYK